MKFGPPALTELMPIHVRDGIKSCEIANLEKGCICVRTRVTHGMDERVRKLVGHLMRRQHRWGNIENQLVITGESNPL